jgi:HAE1 family hydrophobic/amphiphilic exporter-1
MGQAVIGGVITSSLLTLVVVPVVYCYLDDLAAWAMRKLRRPAGATEARAPAGGGGTAAAVPASRIDRLPHP